MAGTLMGTPPYMAPEQIRGEEADKRADIWAFGCVVYEMLTGRAAFARETVADTLAAVLEQEPDWSKLPPDTPALVLSVLRRCLRKDPHRRLHDVADARIELDDATADPGTVTHGAPIEPGTPSRVHRGTSWTTVCAFGLMAALAAGAATWAMMRDQLPSLRPLQVTFRIQPPPGTTFPGNGIQLAVSPDGERIVFSAGEAQTWQLYERPVDQLDAVPLEGTTGALRPFFSPGGDWIAFNVDGDLKKVSLAAGDQVTLCEDCVSDNSDATWHGDTIVFDRDGRLWRIPAAGAPSPDQVAEPRREHGEARYDRPDFLPTGESVVFELARADTGPLADGAIALLDLETEEVTILAEEGADPVYLPPGYVPVRAGDDANTALQWIRIASRRSENRPPSGSRSNGTPMAAPASSTSRPPACLHTFPVRRSPKRSGHSPGSPRTARRRMWVRRPANTTGSASRPTAQRSP